MHVYKMVEVMCACIQDGGGDMRGYEMVEVMCACVQNGGGDVCVGMRDDVVVMVWWL